MNNEPVGNPGVGTTYEAAARRVLYGDDRLADYLPKGRTIRGAVSRDPLNVNDVDVLRTGLLMGKITASEKFAPSIIGTLGDAYDGAATQMNFLNVAEAAELLRRVGATGTFKITGPPSAAGVVQTATVTYSAIGAGTGGDEVQTFTPNDVSSAGTYRVKLSRPDGSFVYTATIAWDATLAECQTAIDTALGTANLWVASSAGSAAPWSAGPIALVLTASGTGYLKTDMAMCSIDIASLTGVASMTEAQTTRGIPVAGTVTVTAVGAAEDCIQTITIGGTHTGGTLKLGFRPLDDPTGEIKWTDTIAWHATEATMTASVNAALDDLLGASEVVCTTIADTAATVLVLTFSGTNATGLVQGLVACDVSAYTGASTVDTVMTNEGVTASVNDFIAGSLIQPTDGSETPITIIPDGFGIKVTDENVSSVDVPFPRPLIGGLVDTAGIVNYPTDTSLITQVKTWLRSVGGKWMFSDDL